MSIIPVLSCLSLKEIVCRLYSSKNCIDSAYGIAEQHHFKIEKEDYILCVSNSALFESGKVVNAIIDAFDGKDTITFSRLVESIDGKISLKEIEEGVSELIKIQLIQPVDKFTETPTIRTKISPEQPVGTLVCILSKNCNLNCGYCYAERKGDKETDPFMGEEIALHAIDFLLENSGQNKVVFLTFFGGEPLLNFPVIKSMASYGKKRAGETGKRINFSMTTNATLLTKEIIDFLNHESIGITISIDGSKETHDRIRKNSDGRGSYEIVKKNVSELFRLYKNKPIRARVTVTRGAVNIKDIFFHLREIGFHEIGFSPVSTANERYALSEEDMRAFTWGFHELAELYVERAVNNENLGFSNLSNVLKQIHDGINKPYPCGGGVGLMGLDINGDLYVCHRLMGRKEFLLGNLRDGIDRERQTEFLSMAHLKRKEECQGCWARFFCGGGCYHETVVRNGTVTEPPLHYCKWLRQWIEIGLKAYVRISEDNPSFIKRSIDGELIC